MKCTDCNTEAVFVDQGREIGSYYYCRSCKKEEAEWGSKAPSVTAIEALSRLNSAGTKKGFIRECTGPNCSICNREPRRGQYAGS